jgi:protein ImuA
MALPLGLPAIDDLLAGGLALRALHEIAPAASAHLGAAFGFALAIAAQAVRHCSPDGANQPARSAAGWHNPGAAFPDARIPDCAIARHGRAIAPSGLPQARHALWIETDYVALEGGNPYGTGLDSFGLPMDRLLILRVARPIDALWGFEEALKSAALAAVITELPESGAAADLTATRRLSLAARADNGLGLLLRHRKSPGSTTAMTRWEVGAAPSEPDRFGGFGRTAFDLSLTRNRRGRCGRFIVHWDHERGSFIPQALSLGLAETACDRPDRPEALAHAG